MQEDPSTQIEQDLLTHARRQHRVPGDQHGPEDAGREVGDDTDAEGQQVALQRGGQPLVDPVGDERRPGDLPGGADDDHDQGQHDAGAHRPQQRDEQADRPGADLLALLARVVVALLTFDAGDAHFSTSRRLSGSSDEIT